MLSAWRLTRPQYVSTALSGEGSARYPGRWNVRGGRVAYVSGHLSLATLEVLAHAESLEMLDHYVALEIKLPDDGVTTVEELPENWQQSPPPDSTRQLGQAWLEQGETLLLRVPSVLIPDEYSYLINPQHEAFGAVEVGEPVPLPFDSRILKVVDG